MVLRAARRAPAILDDNRAGDWREIRVIIAAGWPILS
jgi:hypothetical protein